MTAARRPSLSFLLIMEINGRLRIKSCALMLQPGLRAASRPVIQALGYVGRRSEQAATAGTRCRCMGGREGEREEEGGRCVWGEGIGSERVRGGYRKKKRREERQRAMRWREESCPQIDPQQHQTASASPSSLSPSLPLSVYISPASLARSLALCCVIGWKKEKKPHSKAWPALWNILSWRVQWGTRSSIRPAATTARQKERKLFVVYVFKPEQDLQLRCFYTSSQTCQ